MEKKFLPDAEPMVIRLILVPSEQVIVLAREEPSEPPLVPVPLAVNLENDLGCN